MTIWPRGISREKVDVWMKELGTPKELIHEWKSGKISWEKYTIRYRASLGGREELLRKLAEESRKGTITLLCTEKDPNLCHRSLLKSAIEQLRWTLPDFSLHGYYPKGNAAIKVTGENDSD